MKVKGFCPFCAHPDPEVGPDAWLRCTNPECPHPDGVGELLLDNEIHHIVRFTEDGWTARHPLRERVNGKLLDCGIHSVIKDRLDHFPAMMGTYRLKAEKFDPAWLDDPEYGGGPWGWEGPL